jgi:hypothetical protein
VGAEHCSVIFSSVEAGRSSNEGAKDSLASAPRPDRVFTVAVHQLRVSMVATRYVSGPVAGVRNLGQIYNMVHRAQLSSSCTVKHEPVKQLRELH